MLLVIAGVAAYSAEDAAPPAAPAGGAPAAAPEEATPAYVVARLEAALRLEPEDAAAWA